MLQCQKHLFNLDPSIHYLNCGYMSPLLKSVEEVGIESIKSKRNPFHITPENFFTDSDLLREEFRKLIRAERSDQIAIIPSASYGLSTVAKNVKLNPGDEIIVLEEQFPSNYYTWERIANDNGAKLIIVSAPDSNARGKDWGNQILESINQNTRLVAMPHIHWADGTKFNLREIRDRTNEVDALLIIDGTQSVGALPLYVDEIRPDALICAGYKWLMGPYSIGLAYFGPAFDEGVPLEENWINRKDSEDFKGLVNYQSEYQQGALRYEVGEHSNFILVPMMLEALKQINNWGVENISSYCTKLSLPTLKELSNAGYNIEDSLYRSNHLFGIRMEGFNPTIFNEKLSLDNIYVSVRGDAIRVSVNIFNDQNDLDALRDVCMDLIR